jgi:hypothetical protein
MLLESLAVALVVLANVTVPVVPDPNYLQQLYPPINPNTGFNSFGQQPVTQEPNGSAAPTDIAGMISLAVTAGLGYLFQRNKTTMDRRTYMAADTTVKLAANDQASDAQNLNIAYALTCIADIMGKHHREDMETYQTRDGVSLWTYIEILNESLKQNFKAKYINTTPVDTTGTQSKDKVVATFNKVQQSVTPTGPNIAVGTATLTAGGRVQANQTANLTSAAAEKEKSNTAEVG